METNYLTALTELEAYVKCKEIESGVDISHLENLVSSLRKQLKKDTCRVREFDGEFYPHTLCRGYYKIESNVDYPCMWVNVENAEDYGDGEGQLFLIKIEDDWHQAQSIDFEFDRV